MKIIIDFATFSLLESLTRAEMDAERDIIYQDANLVCMIPKTQRASKIYGAGANWCQKEPGGFDNWSEGSLLVRFLFKTGRKLRFTLDEEGEYHWASERGLHLLYGKGDPFDCRSERGRTSHLEADILALIATIPEACKTRVREIMQCGVLPAYATSPTRYLTAREQRVDAIVNRLNSTKLRGRQRVFVEKDPDSDRRVAIIWSTIAPDRSLKVNKEVFGMEEVDALEQRVDDIISHLDNPSGGGIPPTDRTQRA